MDALRSLEQRIGQLVSRGGVEAKINGQPFRIIAIFDAQAFNEMRDLDGTDLLPFDLQALPVIKNGLIADDDAPRIPAERVLLCPAIDLPIKPENASGARMVSVAIRNSCIYVLFFALMFLGSAGDNL